MPVSSSLDSNSHHLKIISDSNNTVGFYAGLNLIAWGMIFCFVRETKQLTLEEIDRKSSFHFLFSLSFLALVPPTSNCEQTRCPNKNPFPQTEVFQTPTKDYISHEIKYMIPYFFKKRILRQKIERPAPVVEKAELVRSEDIKGA